MTRRISRLVALVGAAERSRSAEWASARQVTGLMILPVTIGSTTDTIITSTTASISATGPMIAAAAARDGTTARATNSA